MKMINKALMIAGCLFASTSLFAQAEKGDWANFGRFEQENKTVKIPANVVFMGNSITEGWINTHPEFFKDNNFVGRGISGQTTSEMLVRFRQDVINLKPKAVVIMAGINDIAYNNGFIKMENIFGNLVSMAELAKINKIKVIFCSIMPAYDFPWRPGLEPWVKVLKINEWIKDYCEKNNLTYVDYHSALKDEREGMPANLSKDGVHTNMEGYKIMEKLVLEGIEKTLR